MQIFFISNKYFSSDPGRQEVFLEGVLRRGHRGRHRAAEARQAVRPQQRHGPGGRRLRPVHQGHGGAGHQRAGRPERRLPVGLARLKYFFSNSNIFQRYLANYYLRQDMLTEAYEYAMRCTEFADSTEEDKARLREIASKRGAGGGVDRYNTIFSFLVRKYLMALSFLFLQRARGRDGGGDAGALRGGEQAAAGARGAGVALVAQPEAGPRASQPQLHPLDLICDPFSIQVQHQQDHCCYKFKTQGCDNISDN